MKLNYFTSSFFLLLLVHSLTDVNCQILNYDTKITIEDNGKKTTNKTVLIQINNKESNWLSHVELAHSPNKKLTLKSARILNANGEIVRSLKKKALITRNELSYQAFYQDDLITEFDLYWNQYPYQIEYSYETVELEFLYTVWWTPIVHVNIPTIRSSLELEIQSNYLVNINHGTNVKFNQTEIGDKRIMTWSCGNIKTPKIEIYGPPLKDLIPVVSVVPSDFNYGINGSFDSWSSFGAWLDKLNDGTDDLLLSEKAVIDKLVAGTSDTIERIRKIFHYHQDHTTYINVAFGVGGLRSYPASYVCKNKYGDCKALTTYMKSMLKSIGIDSYYTVINAGLNQPKIQRNFPSQQFNHVILAVPVEDDTIWLENTSSVLPFNYQGTFTQNRLAFVINDKNSELVHTPKMKLADVLTERSYKFQISDQGEWEANIIMDLHGENFEKFQYLIMSNQNKEAQLNKVLGLADLRALRIKKWHVIDFNRDTTNIKINVYGDCPTQLRKVGNLEVISPLKIDLPKFEKPSERKLSLRINLPINQLDHSSYDLNLVPEKEVQLPEAIDINSKYGRYKTFYRIVEKRIEVRESFQLFRGDYALSEYPKFYSFINIIINHKKKSAIVIR